jgi:hypothetical protein
MRRALSRIFPLFALLTIVIPSAGRAMDATVPSIPFPDLQSAVAALSVSPDVLNNIFIATPSITTGNSIVLTNAFNSGRQLVIRPATTVARARILSTGANSPILSLSGSGNVTIQDLDIVRSVTNTADLIQTVNTTFITIERCRIGSSEPPGFAGLSYISILYPADGGITIRNCIFFSTYKQAFDYGINVVAMGDASNEVFLYNDCVADYNLVGVQVNDATSGSLVLLRNNVVVNNLISVPEPVAYHSAVIPGVIVVTSNNVAFASAANVQTLIPPNQDIYGTAASEVGIDLPPTLGEETSSFVTMDWDATPGAANTDFYRTRETGPLHASSATWGVNVGPGTPDPHDTPVGDDFERQLRPGGTPAHTDRGPFQLDPASAGVAGATEATPLRVSPYGNPARIARLRFSTGIAGELTASLYDVAGRSAGVVHRAVGAGESGTLTWSGVRPGLYAYRVSLRGPGASVIQAKGRVSILR